MDENRLRLVNIFNKFSIKPGEGFYITNNWMLISFFFALLISLFTSQILIALSIVVILVFIYFFGDKGILGLIIVGYLAAPSEYIGESRVYINLLMTGLLIYLFIKEFGFRFDEYIKIPKGIFIFIIVLFCTLFISSVFSSYTLTGFYAIIRTGIFFTICYMFYSLLKNEDNIYLYIYAIIGVFIIYGIRILLDFFNFGIQNYFIRTQFEGMIDSYGSYAYTGMTTFFISISFIVALLFLNKNRKKVRLLLSTLLILNVIILILANSRGGIFAAFLSVSFILVMLRKTLFIKVYLITISAIIISLLTIPSFIEIFNIYFRSAQISMREVFWESGINVINDYPLFGIGPDVFDRYFYSYAPSSINSFFESGAWRSGRPTPHNFFLYFTAENGILGFITALTFFVMFFYLAIKTVLLRSEFKRDYFILVTTITGIGIGIFVRSFFEVTGHLYYGYITTDLSFWITFGILISIYNQLKSTNNL